MTRFVASLPKNGSILPMSNPRKISSSLLAFARTKINTHGVQGRMRAQVRFSPLKNAFVMGMTLAIIVAKATRPTARPSRELPRRI